MLLRSLRLVGFKSFRDARIPFGPFTLLVGTNASGKSNVQDALRFLHGCAQGFSLAEVMDEKWGQGGLLLWRGIRGGAREIAWAGRESFSLEAVLEDPRRSEYAITVEFRATKRGRVPFVVREVIREGVHLSRNDVSARERSFLGEEKVEHSKMTGALLGVRFLDLTPETMRIPSSPGLQVLGDRGENLSAVLLNITSDEGKKAALLGWLRALTPLDVVDLRFHEDLLGRVLVYLVESSGRETSAPSASDGTLRFLALAAALLSSESGRLFFIEEIDNGLHPTRLHLLLDVIEQATRTMDCQVVATTHNPQLLAFLSPKTREDAVLLYRREHENASEVVRVLDLPDVRRVLASQDLGRLFATGWLEDAVEFLATGVEDAPPKAKVKGRR